MDVDPDSPMDVVTVLKSFQNHCTAALLPSEPSERNPPRRTRNELRAELEAEGVDAETWEPVATPSSLVGNLRLPPPPDLMLRAHHDFGQVTPERIGQLWRAAKRRLAAARQFRAAQQAAQTAESLRASDTSTSDDRQAADEDLAASWYVVAHDEAGEPPSSSETSLSTDQPRSVWTQLERAADFVFGSFQRYPLRDSPRTRPVQDSEPSGAFISSSVTQTLSPPSTGDSDGVPRHRRPGPAGLGSSSNST